VARTKEFDANEALARATDLFRRKGFVAASVDDLVAATGLSRSSLYGTFGTKEQLYLAVLARYRTEMMARLVPDPEAPVAIAIERFLGDLLDALVAWGEQTGCLITTTCAEFGNTPAAVRDSCTQALAEQEAQLRAYFEAARDRKALPADADPDQLAAYVVALRQSIGLLWRAGKPRATLDGIIRAGVRIPELNPPRGRPTSTGATRTAARRPSSRTPRRSSP
jgi:TetR/AcrR family transcriptional repressor of nem operon